MSITDELRKTADDIASTAVPCGASPDYIGVRRKIDAIADRIDAEHERALRETGEEIVGDVRKEWIPLPVDADGIPVHIGDVMEWARVEDDGLTIVREVSAVGNGVFFAWSDEQHRYAQYEAHAYRHHHAPTVEDVLREFALKVAGEECMTMRTGVVEEFAAKLRLAKEEDA